MIDLKDQLEMVILKRTQIIITTCRASGMEKLNCCKFTRVILDEAAQSQEIESHIALRHA